LRQVRQVVENQAGLDEELLRRCGHLIRSEAFDGAVRSAFVLLEERLRDATNAEGMTGTQLANHALSFVQHVKTLLKIHGRAAVVVPDNVLFEGGAGETVRRKLLHECDVHTLPL